MLRDQDPHKRYFLQGAFTFAGGHGILGLQEDFRGFGGGAEAGGRAVGERTEKEPASPHGVFEGRRI